MRHKPDPRAMGLGWAVDKIWKFQARHSTTRHSQAQARPTISSSPRAEPMNRPGPTHAQVQACMLARHEHNC